MTDVTKTFGETVANDRVSFAVGAGEVHALLGENGAGKTTLMNILYGLMSPDEGEIAIGGEAVSFRGPADAIAAGVGMVHQHPLVVGPMTVAENLSLAGLGDGTADGMLRALEPTRETMPLDVDPRARVDSLPMSLRQRIEIVRCLAHGVRVLVLDEPTAVLTPDEVEHLFVEMRRIAAAGRSVIFITHKLAEVEAIADRVTVLRRGRTVGSFETAGIPSAELATRMVGRDLAAEAVAPAEPGPHAEPQPDERAAVRLALERVSVVGEHGDCELDEVDLEVHAGEIVTIAGVEGNGQRPLASLLFGALAPTRGRVLHDGTQLPPLARWAARRIAIGRIPEDRRHEGLLLSAPLWENLLYAPGLARRRGLLRRRALIDDAARRLAEFGVVPCDPRLPASALSGGNQQKVILARELSSSPGAVVAVNPTRGLDIGAQLDVQQRLRALRGEGIAVLVISTDLDEVMALGDRIGVLYRGRLSGPYEAARIDRDRLGHLMCGLEARVG